MPRATRRLVAGDNLDALAKLDAGIATVAYLDPPFNSRRAYGAFLAKRRSSNSDVLEAFGDSLDWTESTTLSRQSFSQWMTDRLAVTLEASLSSLHSSPLGAYMAMMVPRLAETVRLLDDRGSLYVHCDPAASPYLRIVLDQILGPSNFRNEIVWRRTHAHSSSRRFGPVHDTILFYTKSGDYVWNEPRTPYRREYLERFFRDEDERGAYQLITCTAPGDRQGTQAHYEWRGQLPPPGRHWAWRRVKMEEFERAGLLAYSSNGVPRLKKYASDSAGVAVQDIWTDINRLDAHSEERLGFETQKPVALLERIVRASSNAGDVVLDPFAGTGTTGVAAERSGRGWILVDNSLLATSLSLSRLRQEANDKAIELEGFPHSESVARQIQRRDPVAYGAWATAMLATVVHRDSLDSRLAVGMGRIRFGRRVDLISWVPIRSGYKFTMPQLPLSRLDKLALYVEDRSATRLRASLESAFPGGAHGLSIADLVGNPARREGLAPRIRELAGART